MKDANRGTQLKEQPPKHRNQPDGPITEEESQTHEGNARDGDASTLRKNRSKLGVNEAHRTEEMERGKRGTFP
jgi:hypothetical protein